MSVSWSQSLNSICRVGTLAASCKHLYRHYRLSNTAALANALQKNRLCKLCYRLAFDISYQDVPNIAQLDTLSI